MTCPHCQKELERCTHASLHEEIRMFLFKFLIEKVGLDPTQAAVVSQEFRDYRKKLAEEFRKLQEGK